MEVFAGGLSPEDRETRTTDRASRCWGSPAQIFSVPSTKAQGPSFLYGALRASFVHTLPFYKWVNVVSWPPEVSNDRKGGLRKARPCGLEIQDTRIILYTNTYAADFMSALKEHVEKVSAGDSEVNERLEQAILSVRQVRL